MAEQASRERIIASLFGARVAQALSGADGSIDVTPIEIHPNARFTAERRYLLKDDEGKVKETLVQLFGRVAAKLAAQHIKYAAATPGDASDGAIADETFERFRAYYDTLRNFRFVPGGRTLANEGTSVPNCIVLHPHDSLDNIFQVLHEAALLQKAGSGLGFPLHLMRPTGLKTRAVAGEASGPVSFLHVYNAAFGVIKQQNRNGANMAIMRVDHPDILEFVHCKAREGSIVNFNISVGLTHEFMRQVLEKCPDPWVTRFGDQTFPLRRITRDSERCTSFKITDVSMTASELFEEIVKAAWRNGEPGCVFLDAVNETNPLPGLGPIHSSNPCGEQFLHDGDVCNLGAVNLALVYDEKTGDLNEDLLRRTVTQSIRMLEDVVDTFALPVKRVEETARNTRRLGLGVMGFADYLFKRRIAYDSQECLEEVDRIMTVIKNTAVDTTRALANERGVFAFWDKSVYATTNDRRRNAYLTCVAPTGTTAMFANVNGGIEPIFMLAFRKMNIMNGSELNYDIHPSLREALEDAGIWSEALVERISRTGSLKGVAEVPEYIRRVFVTAMDITPEWHVRVQAAFQKHIDNAISKTCNFPREATVNDVIEAYMKAWQLGCKGLTVYRSGSREKEVLVSSSTEEDTDKQQKKASAARGDSPAKNSEAASEHTATVIERAGSSEYCPDCKTGEYMMESEGCFECRKCGFGGCEG